MNTSSRRFGLTGWIVPTATILLLGACAQPDPSVPAGATTTSPGATTLTAGACLDASGSTDGEFHESVRAAIGAALSRWYPPTDLLSAGAPPTAGLDLFIFPVTSATTRYDVTPFTARLEPLAALPPLPGDADSASTWALQKVRWTGDHDEGERAARAAADDLAQFRFARPDRSGVYSCLSALADRTAGTSGARVAVFSDLEDNTRPQIGGDLRGASITLVAPCPSGDLRTCQRRIDEFTKVATQLGAADVTVADAKNPEASVENWLDSAPGIVEEAS